MEEEEEEVGADEIIKQGGGIYSVDSPHKSVRQQSHTPHAQTDCSW